MSSYTNLFHCDTKFIHVGFIKVENYCIEFSGEFENSTIGKTLYNLPTPISLSSMLKNYGLDHAWLY